MPEKTDEKEEISVSEMTDKVIEKNKEGIEMLGEEKLAERRRNEGKISKIKRKIKRKLGLRKVKSQTIDLN